MLEKRTEHRQKSGKVAYEVVAYRYSDEQIRYHYAHDRQALAQAVAAVAANKANPPAAN